MSSLDSLRDQFAQAALAGMLGSAAEDRTSVNKAVWAKVAYEFADAMLKARIRDKGLDNGGNVV